MNIAIVGAGLRGTSIAQVAALGGHAVAIYDLNGQLVQQARLRIVQSLDKQAGAGLIPRPEAERAKNVINTTTVLEQFADADFLIEAIPEKLDLKKALIEKLDRITPRTSVLATTSPTFSVTACATAAKRFPERVLGLHFFQPIVAHKLVEVVAGDASSKDMVERSLFWLRSLGKEPITVKDVPGFVAGRLTTVYLGEALRVLGEGSLDAPTIDKLMRDLSLPEGPFQQLDRMGLDSHLAATQALYDAYYGEPRYRPHYLHQKMIGANRLGRKSRGGFYPQDA